MAWSCQNRKSPRYGSWYVIIFSLFALITQLLSFFRWFIYSYSFLFTDKPDAPAKSKKLWQDGETIEFAGKAVTSLAADKNIMARTGKILLTSHLSSEYGFKDVDGSTPSDFTSVSHLMGASGHTWLASWIPSFVRVPLFIVHFGSYKF